MKLGWTTMVIQSMIFKEVMICKNFFIKGEKMAILIDN
jgi:hypothetical protein